MSSLPKGYPLVLLGTLIIIIEYLGLVYAFLMRARTITFSDQYMRKFDELHGRHFKG